MDEVFNVTSEALDRYFNSLFKFGYVNYKDVYKILALISLQDILYSFQEYVSDKDYISIINSIYCLSGSTCFIRYPEYINDDSFTHNSKVNWTIRISEDNVIRVSQDGKFRTEA